MCPLSCDALVIGAGPAGSAAALTLAREGVDVILVDRCAFPRDKVCGDALIPDALAALERLSLKARVLERALTVDRIRIHAPDGTAVDLRGTVACLPRAVLDDLLRRSAIDAGARFLAPLRLAAAVCDDDVVAGARFVEAKSDAPIVVRSRFTVLATGAAVQPLELFGVCERRTASAMAARVYYEVPPDVAGAYDHICLSIDRDICPGYGWIFPGPGGIFNVGAGVFHDTTRRPPTANLRVLLDRFLSAFAPARRIAQIGRAMTPLRGAPLRTALRGAALSRPGLFVAGEAAGLTYSFSGEGIGKAIESGVMAAESILAARANQHDLEAAARVYRTRLVAEFRDRFRGYEKAQRWLSHAWVANVLAHRANRGRYVRGELEDLLADQGDASELFSARGLIRALVG